MISPDQEREAVLAELSRTVDLLAGSMAPVLVTKSGTNIGFALRGARDSAGVAAVSGGFVVQDTMVRAAGPCGFGSDNALAAIILTSAKFDPAMRSAATIRYTEEEGRILNDMFLECCTIDRRGTAPGIGTMDWGVASCCRDGVPEAMIDRGLSGDPPRIHLFGEKPADIAGNIIMLSNRILDTAL
ncbi:thiamine-phosphate synthase family protein [Methanoregula sp.]|uniref:thiamine-phosphate synthase family protein n=1 Tax=Methanoregula sp. TaxID=2052170 RepID=UPI002B5A283C|nr:thiamine-phosphate synthase family protein [Methanoregula sp.]HVP95825.1 thiamine-phosphate synthase family protein [Methanoregula sp.]